MPLALDASGVSTTNLVAYYKFESGAITTDSSGNSKTLTNNGTVASVSGLIGNCADFGTANTTKSFSRTDGLGVDMSGNFSLNYWLKIRTDFTSDALYDIIRWESSTGTSRYLSHYYQRFGGGIFRISSNISEGYASYDVQLGTDNWYMVTCVGSGTLSLLYLNGEKVASATRGTNTLSNKLQIGCTPGGTQYTNAYIDDMSFWSRALTDDEIGALADLVPPSVILV